MIRGNVGENTIVKQDTVYPVHFYPLRRHLHNRMGTAGLCHLRKGFMEFIGFRRSIHGGRHMISNHNAGGADKSNLLSRRLQNRLDHMGGGGLTLGAGNTDHGKFLRRIAKPGRR